jgi:hypothetical protein
MNALQVSSPYEVTLLHSIAAPVDLERHLHERFASYRHRGEWFRIEGELAAWIDAGFPYES